MAFNYFVAYDLDYPGQNYDAVIDRIKSLGDAAHIQLSLFYLKSDLTTNQVHAAVRAVMDTNDKLAVIWANHAIVSNYHTSHIAILEEAFASGI